jgi:hypothetical protein
MVSETLVFSFHDEHTISFIPAVASTSGRLQSETFSSQLKDRVVLTLTKDVSLRITLNF